jgi:hypothetical protein
MDASSLPLFPIVVRPIPGSARAGGLGRSLVGEETFPAPTYCPFLPDCLRPGGTSAIIS